MDRTSDSGSDDMGSSPVEVTNTDFMPNSYFKFKQFTVYQDNAGMKVGTDGVFIGAWCLLDGGEQRILDVGTGTGLIALMAAQRASEAIIDAMEIDPASAAQAQRNVSASPWSERINIYCSSFQDFSFGCACKYDHVVSNPPFFINSLKPDNPSRHVSRHTTELPYEDLIAGVCRVIKPQGIFSTIFPFNEANLFVAMAAVEGLYCTRRTDIYSVAGGPLKRVALEFSLERRSCELDSIVIGDNSSGGYTEEYRRLTSGFYLKF